MKPAIVFLILGLATPLFAGAQDSSSLEQMRKAAARGNAAEQLEMGILYEFGYNMPKNNVSALAWYLLSADQGNELAIKRRGLLKSQMKPDEIEAAQKLSQELAAQKPQATATPPAVEPAPAPSEAAPASEAPPAGSSNVDKPSTTP